jgi:putative ABC transport system permease protein
MLESHIVIALRQLAAQKLYSAINILGLTVGLAAAIMVGLFVRHELSYDAYHPNADRVYRVSQTISPPGAVPFHDATVSSTVAPALQQDFDEIETTARLFQNLRTTIDVGERSYMESGVFAADDTFLRMFDFEWLEGDSSTAMRELNSVILTESMSRKYFGAERALGRTIVIQRATPVTVTGVIRDLPDNTHMRFDLLTPLRLYAAAAGVELESWTGGLVHTYIVLRAGADPARIQAQSREFLERHGHPELIDLMIEPLTRLHLSLPRLREMRPPGNLEAIYASGAIAALILAIACINFVNLATAQARRRAKEVGVRKTLGAERGRLIVQFLGESLVLTAIAVMLAIALVELLLPMFGAFVQRDLELDAGDPRVLAAIGALALAVGLTAGSFPAFYLSAFDPAKVLSGNVTRGRTAMMFRSMLVGAQFAICIALLIATIVVYRQVTFMRNVDLGYDTEQMVIIDSRSGGQMVDRWDTLRNQWLAHPEVVAVTASTQAPGELANEGIRDSIRVEGSDLQALPPIVHVLAIDPSFFETYGVSLLAGRMFSPDIGTDARDMQLTDFPQSLAATSVAIINARAASAFGYTPEEAVGKRFWSEGSAAAGQSPAAGAPMREIVGVVDDVYFQPLRQPIEPMIFILPRLFADASIKISGRNLESTLAHIDDVWSRVIPEQPILRRFLDDDFAAMYRGEQRQSQLLRYCALLAVLLAGLGLFGLASLTTEQRTREIGIRRVLGGTLADIVRLFAGEFGKLVLLANLVAWPIAYFAMQRWLNGFPNRVELDLLVFIGSGLLVLAIAWATVAAVVTRAAAVRPAVLMRNE